MQLLIILAFIGIVNGLEGVNRMVRTGSRQHVVKTSDFEDYEEETTSTTTTTTQAPITAKPIQASSQCQEINAYYTGTFKGAWASSYGSVFKAKFHIKLAVNKTEKRVNFTPVRVSTDASGKDDVFFHFYKGYDHVWTENTPNKWQVVINHQTDRFEFHVHDKKTAQYYSIMDFPKFTDEFILNQPVGQCTNKQIINPDVKPDGSVFEYCVCCGDYQSGGPLNCPVMFADDKVQPTPKPVLPIQDTTTTVQAPITKQVAPVYGGKCDAITAYYIGKFQSKWTTSSAFQAQFQVKMKVDKSNNRVWMTSETVNKSYTPGKTVFTHFYTRNGGNDVWTDMMDKTKWSVPFVRSSEKFELHVHARDGVKDPNNYSYRGSGAEELFTIMTFPYFNNEFVLNQPVGDCTKQQIINPDIGAKEGLFEYCVCCGEYQEGGPLNCPKNPWVNNPQADDSATQAPQIYKQYTSSANKSPYKIPHKIPNKSKSHKSHASKPKTHKTKGVHVNSSSKKNYNSYKPKTQNFNKQNYKKTAHKSVRAHKKIA